MDPKYILFPEFLYLKTGVQSVVLINEKFYGYHNGKVIYSENYNPWYNIVNTQHNLFDDFKLIVDHHLNLTWQDLMKYITVSIENLPPDILREISQFLPKKEYHRFATSSVGISSSLQKNIKYIEKRKKTWGNQLEAIFMTYPDMNWDYQNLSKNPATTSEMIKKSINKEWDFNYLSERPDSYLDLIREYPNKDWNWIMISRKITLTDNIFKEFFDKWDWDALSTNSTVNINLDGKWNMRLLTKNSAITVDDLEKDYHWNLKEVIYNPNVTVQYLDKHKLWNKKILSNNISLNEIENYPDRDWDWELISRRKVPGISHLVERFPDKPWNWRELSNNSSLEVSTVMKLPDKEWNFLLLSMKSNITIDFIDRFINNKLRSLFDISRNPKITKDIGEKRKDWNWNWNWKNISNINIEFLLKHLNKPWNWKLLSTSPTMEVIIAHPDLPWDYHGLSNNPNLTFEFVSTHITQPWDWKIISQNSFNINEEEYVNL